MNPGNILIWLIFQAPWGQNGVLHCYEGKEYAKEQGMNRRSWNLQIQIDTNDHDTFVYRLLIIPGAVWKWQKQF